MTSYQVLSSTRLLAGPLIKAHILNLCPFHASAQTGSSRPSSKAEPWYPDIQSPGLPNSESQAGCPRTHFHVSVVYPDSPLSEVQPSSRYVPLFWSIPLAPNSRTAPPASGTRFFLTGGYQVPEPRALLWVCVLGGGYELTPGAGNTRASEGQALARTSGVRNSPGR